MKLNVLERMVLLQVLPVQGNLTTLRIVADLRNELSFTEEEHARLDFQVDTASERLTWNEDGTLKDVEFGAKAMVIVQERLEELDRQEKLTAKHLPLCDKFEYGA